MPILSAMRALLPFYAISIAVVALAVFWGTAVYLAWRKRNDWLVLYISATLLMMSFLFAFRSDVDRWRFPAGLLAIFPAIEWLAPTLFAICFFLLFYLFPDGRFTPRWIGLAGVVGAAASLFFFAGLEITVTAPDPLPPLPAAVEVATYRIVLEAMTNCVRHAHAQVCAVSLQLAADLRLEIRDDGCGLPVGYQAGVGLAAMRERTAELGGSFQIESAVGVGTAIIVHIPFV